MFNSSIDFKDLMRGACILATLVLIAMAPLMAQAQESVDNLAEVQQELLVNDTFRSCLAAVNRDTGWKGEQKTIEGLARLRAVLVIDNVIVVGLDDILTSVEGSPQVTAVELHTFGKAGTLPMARWKPEGMALPEGVSLWIVVTEAPVSRFNVVCNTAVGETWGCITSLVGSGPGAVAHDQSEASVYKPWEHDDDRGVLVGAYIDNKPGREAIRRRVEG